ncbi:hypothetical protein RIF23_11115 [Lipingzhangella sp. LS1_29]|uniref:ASPIC/UnbV domain-containing protein n=1 Tax=Lipingzhangella rawalii TaxID=2055835 RepID=A0ABU2H6B6_9ACTN|nr:hypothetical protein [Lipingzhangella rawalii]MDS1270851.1 hypothetical protein [Lipingzhangella rawalii]
MPQHHHPQFQIPDELLLSRLAAAVNDLDAAPTAPQARHAFALRRPDAAVAELRADTAVDPPVGLRDRSEPDTRPRVLEFQAPQLQLRLEITTHGRRRDVVGQLHSTPDVTSIEIRWPTGHHLRPVATDGSFSSPAVPAGPFSVLCHRRSATPVATTWVCV